jgi:cysteine desulfurase
MSLGEHPIYLDYAATTPLDAGVANRMLEVQTANYANPSSNHVLGRQSAALIAGAAQQLAAVLNVSANSLLWTSGATESSNLAILGAARQRGHRGKHVITLRTEHKAVADAFVKLEQEGFEVTWLTPDQTGHLDVRDFAAALREDTQLASIMHINNETGAQHDIAALGALCRERGVCLHVDGAQAIGKIHVDLSALPVDLYSMTAHKFYGPSGIGVLYIADGVQIEPLLFGGGQQRRLRPGTMATDLIVGLGEAVTLAAGTIHTELQRLTALRERFWGALARISGVRINGDPVADYPGILNVSVDGVEGESLLLALEPLCVATGSACNSQTQEPSYVLRAMGCSDRQAQSAIRFSMGRQTTIAEIDFAARHYAQAVEKLRHLAPAT